MVNFNNCCGQESLLSRNLDYGLVTEDGLLVCTNGVIMLVYDIEYNFNASNEGKLKVKNKLIHKDILKKLSLKSVHHIEFLENKIIAKNKKGIVLYEFFYSGSIIKSSKHRDFEINDPVTGKTIDGKRTTFPDWRSAIPKEKILNIEDCSDFRVDMNMLKKIEGGIINGYYTNNYLDIKFLSKYVLEAKARETPEGDRTKGILYLLKK